MDPPERDSAVFVDESARTSFDSPSVGAVPDSRTGSHEEGSKTAAYSGQSTPKNPSDRPPLGHRAASRERELRPDSQAERKKSPPDLPAAAVQALGSAIGGADAAPVAMPSPGCRQQPWMDFGELTAEQNAQEDIAALGQAEGNIEIDNDESTFDAGYASDANSLASTSLTSSVRNYTFENGRRYHKFREGRYHFPNDDVEQEREDMKHAMYMMLCQQLHFAPIGDSPHQILDVGTGTGIWAIESESLCAICFLRIPF